MKNSRDAATTIRTKNKTKKKIQTLIKFTVTEQDICFSSSLPCHITQGLPVK